MSQGEIAMALVLLGVLLALRFEVFAVLVTSVVVVVTLVVHGVATEQSALIVVVQTIVGVVLFQGSYVLGGMVLTQGRRLVARVRHGRPMPHKKDR